MAETKKRISVLVFALLLPVALYSQWKNPAATIPDTSDYMLPIYSDALGYNLMVASSRGYISEIERLIKRGADVNAETPDGATPLVFAVTNKKKEAVAALLKHEPVVDKITASGETPLLMAVKNQSFDIAEMLIRAGADVNYSDRHGATSLHYATIYGYSDITDLLLYYDANKDEKTADGSTPLHAAIWAGQITIADILLQNGSEIDEKDNVGMTPFLLAAYFGDTIALDILLNYGADLSAKNNKGYNAITIAIMSEQIDAVEYLLEKRTGWEADGPAADPYTVASKYRRKEILSLLQEKNIPGKIKYQVDQVSFTLSSRFTANDMYSGLSFEFREPLLYAGFSAGFDTKLWPTRVLVKESDALFYQYWDRSSLVYAGLFRDFTIKEIPAGPTILFTASLRGGYSFGNRFEGSYAGPESRFRILPSAAFRINTLNLSISAGAEYANTGYYRPRPLWLRVGIGWTFFFDDVRMKIKPPKWY